MIEPTIEQRLRQLVADEANDHRIALIKRTLQLANAIERSTAYREDVAFLLAQVDDQRNAIRALEEQLDQTLDRDHENEHQALEDILDVLEKRQLQRCYGPVGG